MAPATRKQFTPDPDISSAFAISIEVAHAEVELCIVALESILVDDKLADPDQFSTVRHRLAHANLTRTQVAREACTHLISITPTDNAQPLRDLQQSEIEHFQMISQHIRHWTPQTVQDHWHGYRDATQKVLTRARELVTIEKRVLLPLLRERRF